MFVLSLEASGDPKSDPSRPRTGFRHGCHPLLGQNRKPQLYLQKRVPMLRFLIDSWALFVI